MKAAIVQGPGKNPVYGDFPEPKPDRGVSRITVTASALSHLTKGRASGTHYSSSGKFPFIAGVDGVGRLDDGRRVYFVLPEAPYGGMAEQTIARPSHCIALPDGIDDVTAAALTNPGMSAWAALKERAQLVKGEIVLVNGATGAAGSMAVQIAKFMGAKKVIATGRNPEVLNSLPALGADATISLDQDGDALEEAFARHFASSGIDVVLDYLWGPSAERILIAGAKEGKEAVPIRFIQVGSVSASNITLPAAALRSSAIELMGSGIGSIPLERLIGAIAEMFQAAQPGGFKVSTHTVPLAQIEQAWTAETRARTVFTVGR